MSGVSSGAIPAVALTALRCQGPPEYPKRPWRVFVFGRHASVSGRGPSHKALCMTVVQTCGGAANCASKLPPAWYVVRM
jgi:hypothetical protein